VIEGIVCYELVFRGYLQIISRFKLAVLHVVFFHAHKSRIGICFGITVPFIHRFQVFLIFLQFGQVLLIKFFNLTKFTFTAVLQINGIYLFFQGTAVNRKS
jgi:hypothetical protein